MWEEISKHYYGVTKVCVREFLDKCLVCSTNQPLKKSDPIKNIVAKQCWERIQIDLVDLRQFSEQNDDCKWLLNVIDCYSRYLTSVPLKDKSAQTVICFLC